ncbi:MAG: hypothetical protein HFI93_08365 [Lachnospiraceae bacterium]|nr:hypothetical protein [Lachnospiraceae bacterium]
MAAEIIDSVGFLEEAKAALKIVNEEKIRIQSLEIESKKLEKALKDEKKAQTDLIKLTLKKRKEELAATYDGELTKTGDKIRKEKSRREKAISQGKKARAKAETEELRKQNQQLNQEAKRMFKKEHLPTFCNSTLYYSLFFAKGAKELLVMFLTFLIVFLALPFGVYYLLPAKGIGTIILVYVVDILVFGGSFIIISEKTKMTHPSAIKQGRNYRDAILANKKKIRKIEKSIARDDNNSYYDLEEYDEKLDKLSLDYEEISGQKKEALENFEKVTRKVITDEIIANAQERMDSLSAKSIQVEKELKAAESHAREASLSFTDAYGAYIDKEYWQQEKLDQLIEILKNGEAKSITEAQTIYKTKK